MKRKRVTKTRSQHRAFSGDAQVDAAFSELAKVLSDIARNEQVAAPTQPVKDPLDSPRE